MKLASIPAHLPFLDQLAARWIAAAGHDREAMGHGVIVLPGRRAARALTEAFLRQMDGGGMLLPRIMPIGALDEAELGLSVSSPSPGLDDADRMEPDEAYDRACGPLTLPPAVGGMTRLATLTRLILQAEGAFGTRPTLDQAWPLANALAELMDEAEWAGITLAERLPDAVQDNFAEHWQIILRFLSIVTHAWPAWLREQGVMNPVARQVALLGAQARVWRGMARRGDATRLWAAGFTHVMAPLGHALRAVSACPGGMIILPGLDMDMPGEVFDTLPDSHPQAGMAHLLAVLEATRADVEPWPASGGNPARAAMLARVMLPAQALGDWTRDVAADATVGVTVGATVGATTGVAQGSAAAPGQVQRIEAQDEQEEALAISMIMRDAIETPGHTVALVTPDRALAARVSTELARWGVVADDSAGLALSSTPVAVLLRLIARMVDSGFSPVALLSVLKHPLVACGLSVGTCRASARLLERMVLRGPAPAPGFAALRMAVEDTLSARNRHAQTDTAHTADRPFGPEPLPAFMDRLAFCFEPVLGWTMDQPRAAPGPQARAHQAPLPDLLAGLLAVAERLARTDEEDGPARLWRGEDGNLLAERLGELMLAADILPPQPPVVLDGLLGAVLTQDRAVTRRADPTALHPRVLIWGLFEARLQTAQTVILGGLSEGTWPPVTDAGPWMSRPMRRKVGLPSPELAVGQAAHDFYATVAAAGQVILSCPRRREGAPVVPARWLTRLDAFLAGRGARVPAHPVLAWLRQLDQPPGAANPVAAPRPAPPVALRPRRLSVTEIETWMRDPYAIYARHVLRLEPLAELEEGADASDYGLIVHDALERWVRAHGVAWPDDAEHRLAALFMTCLAERKLRPALRAWWEPRLLRIAQWVAEAETRRRDQNGPPHAILTEARGRVVMPAPAGPFTLVGRADRIDMDAQGGVNVQDYKTGMLPATRDVLAGWSPQLPLEAAMILQGGFEAVPADCSIGALTYWRLTGGADPGQEVSITPREVASLTKLAEQTWQNLLERIAAYDDPTRPYLSHPHPGQEPRFADYARLARVPEWSAARTENDA